MSPDSRSLLTPITLLATILVYYGYAATRVNAWITQRVLDRTDLVRHHARIDVTGVIRLFAAGLLQLSFVALLVLTGAVDWRVLMPPEFRPILLLYGAILGIAETALGSFLCNLGMRVSSLLRGKSYSFDKNAWFVASKGGWMRSFMKTVEIMPAPLTLLTFLLYVGMEETVFRGVVINATTLWGSGVALAVSVVMFVTVQIFHTPTWRTAMFPVLGASMMGIVHGALYLAVPDLTPLIVAHVVFFAMAAV